jgi:histone-lysine N-methyltransferase SETMAR
MLTVFRVSQGVLLAHLQKSGENVNSVSYGEVLLKLLDSILRKRPGQLARGLLLHHDNARPHTAQATRKEFKNYNGNFPNICLTAPSDFHLFRPLKNHLGDKRFAGDGEAETEVRKWLRQQSKDFYAAGLDALVERWDKCIFVGGGYVDK